MKVAAGQAINYKTMAKTMSLQWSTGEMLDKISSYDHPHPIKPIQDTSDPSQEVPAERTEEFFGDIQELSNDLNLV